MTNSIISASRQRHEKTLFSDRKEGEIPWVVPAPDERWQSLFVRQRILELVDEGVPLERIAVLFRSSMHSFDLELELTRAGIEYVKRGGFRFLESAHVKDVLAFLRVLENPEDSVAWGRQPSCLRTAHRSCWGCSKQLPAVCRAHSSCCGCDAPKTYES